MLTSLQAMLLWWRCANTHVILPDYLSNPHFSYNFQQRLIIYRRTHKLEPFLDTSFVNQTSELKQFNVDWTYSISQLGITFYMRQLSNCILSNMLNDTREHHFLKHIPCIMRKNYMQGATKTIVRLYRDARVLLKTIAAIISKVSPKARKLFLKQVISWNELHFTQKQKINRLNSCWK